jgi:hypothetical protein
MEEQKTIFTQGQYESMTDEEREAHLAANLADLKVKGGRVLEVNGGIGVHFDRILSTEELNALNKEMASWVGIEVATIPQD